MQKTQLSENLPKTETAIPLWRQFRWKLILPFILIAVLPVTIGMAIMMTRWSRQATEMVTNQLESVAELKTDQITRWLRDSEAALDLLLADDIRKAGLAVYAAATLREDEVIAASAEGQRIERNITGLLSNAVEVQSAFEELFLYNAEGLVIAASNPSLIGQVIRDEPYFANSLENGFVQTPYYQITDNELAMIVTRPLANRKGETVGVVAGRLDLTTLGQIMTDRTGLGETGDTYLVSQESNYLLTPTRFEDEGYELTRAYHSDGIDRALGGESGSGIYDDYRDPAVPVIGVYRWIPELQVAMLAEVDETEALASFTSARNLSLTLAGIAILVAIIIGSYNARRIAAPITRLTRAATQIAAGNLNQNVQIDQDDEIGALTSVFNQMTARLRETLTGLERRSRDLTLAAEVARRLTTVRDLDQLLAEAVELIRDNFDLYYAQIYLTDAAERSLALRAGSGSVGQQLVRRGHRLPLGPGSINGTAAAEKRAVLVANTTESATFLPNPLLPDTRAEMAVPLIVGAHVVGVLNLQHNQADVLTEESLSTFEALAGQLAIAIENAHLFSETEQARAEVEAYARRLAGQGWDEFLDALNRDERIGFTYARDAIGPFDEMLLARPDEQTLAVPVAVGGEPIGTLQLECHPERRWTNSEAELVSTVAQQVARQVDNLRLLAQAAQYRSEAEAAIRRTTREGWADYLDSLASPSHGFVYDQNQVEPLNGSSTNGHKPALAHSITVRGETVGELAIDDVETVDDKAGELLAIVAEQLGEHLENARLLEEIERRQQLTEESEMKFRSIIESTPMGMFVFQLEPDNRLVLADANPATNRILGIDCQQLIGLTIEEAFPPLAETEMSARFREAAATGKAWQTQEITHNDDQIQGSYEVYAFQTTPGKMVAAFLDITERKQAEALIAKRASELATVAEVSTKASTILDPAIMLQSVVDMTKEHFELYHAHIYLFDQSGETLVLTVGAGEIGRQMVEQGWKIPLDREQSLVAQAARSRQGVVVDDVRQDPNFLPNKLLPATRSEMAIPLLIADKVLGVLDVQSETVNRFTAEDISIQTTLAGQVASALENARLFSEVQKRSRDMEVYSHELERQGRELAKRTRELAASQQVTFAATETTNPDKLLSIVVNLIRDQFDLYHAQVYLVDQEQQSAILRESTGFAGRQLLKQQHQVSLAIDSPVTRAILEGNPILVEDVSQEENWQPHELLPHTQAELVVPLKWGVEVLGVLDIHSRRTDQLSERSVALFQTMTDQITFLFENSALLTRVTEKTNALTHFTEQLRTAAGIAEHLNTILDPDQLLDEAVELMQSRFGLYHAHIYLLASPPNPALNGEESGGVLAGRAGSGDVGRILQEEGHQIPLDLEQSPVARAARTRKTVVIANVEREAGFERNPLLPQTQAEVAIPLVVGEKLLGVLDIQDDQPQRFAETDVDTFNTLAGQMAIALENANLFAERKQAEAVIAKRAIELETVAEVSTAAATVLEPDKLLQNVVERTKESFSLYHAHIYLLETPPNSPLQGGDQGGVLVLAAGAGKPGRQMVAEGWYIPLDREKSLVARAARTKEGVIVNDVQQEAGFFPNPLLPDTRAEMAVPLISGERVIGVLDVQADTVDRFSEEDIRIQTILAGQVAAALENARLYEESIQTAQRLRDVDRMKSEFLANMSHELRTPLNSIIGYSEMILMGMNGELSEEMTQDVQAIFDNGHHLLRVISDILDLAKIEAGRLTLKFEGVSVESLLETVRVNTEGLFMNKPIKLQVETEAALPDIEADPVRLKQILNNLVSNAIKFTEQGQVTLRAFQENGWVCLEVEDTGIGISQEDLGKVFEKFQQVDGSFTRRAEGTGLGLAITRHLTQMHGGDIDVRSQLGQGTTFTVRLPIEGPQADGGEDEAV